MAWEIPFGKKKIKRNVKPLKCAQAFRLRISSIYRQKFSQNEEMTIRIVMKKQVESWDLRGFRRNILEIFVLLGCYAA